MRYGCRSLPDGKTPKGCNKLYRVAICAAHCQAESGRVGLRLPGRVEPQGGSGACGEDSDEKTCSQKRPASSMLAPRSTSTSLVAITIAALCVHGDGLSVASRAAAPAFQQCAPALGRSAARQRGLHGKCVVQLSVAAFPLSETKSACGLSLDYCREAHLLAAAQAAGVGPKIDIAPERVVVGTSAASTRHRTRPARADAEREALAAGRAEDNEAHEPASSNVRMSWLREDELMGGSDEGGTIPVEARARAGLGVAGIVVGEGTDDLLSTDITRFHLPMIPAHV